MFDDFYNNIGGKVKGLAKWTFIIGAVWAVITGARLLSDEDLMLYGLLVLICGPIVAWVSSWILYAFGELVEKTCDNANNTKNILKHIKEKSKEPDNEYRKNNYSTVYDTASSFEGTTTEPLKPATHTLTEKNTIICSRCKLEQPSSRKVCWNCGATFENGKQSSVAHKWECDACKKMRTQTPCEHCGKE